MKLLKKSFKDYIKKHNLISPGDHIIVGVSGGSDSVTLLYLLNELRSELGTTLHVAHYNHNMRKDSLSDQKFVESLSKNLAIPFTAGTWKDFNPDAKGSLEDMARKKRLDFLFKLSKKLKADKIALAHNKDDLAETILMYVLRGTGLNGIRGILPKRDISGYTIIRPLLNTPRKEIDAFLKKGSIPFRKDSTNDETIFFRNKIRHELIPLIEKTYNKNIKEALSNLANNAATDYEYLAKQADKIFKKLVRPPGSKNKMVLDLLKFKGQDISIKRMVIRKCIGELKGGTKRLTLSHCLDVEDLINNKPVKSSLHLPSGVKIQKTSKTLIFVYK